ncbi:30660_t:CDS:2 [Gigaspora margarita]|uniref:30660_t:CDS:1 n=1 Tax=Gigaspora margarita TaxID=4874 RepID=A0ABM8W167_GIGMA|nr:30660_t:CDS:2 [Gigaspora margarita]
MESQFEELKKMLQPLVNKLSENEELEIKGRQVIFKSEGQVLEETIERNTQKYGLYLQDLNQNTEIEPIMPIKTIEVYYKLGNLIAERGWNKEVQKELCQQLTDSKGGLV